MKTIMKFQTKIFLKTKASYVIISIFSILLLALSIFSAYMIYGIKSHEGPSKLSVELPIKIVKYLFYVFIVITIAYVASTILYRYKNEGIELILLTKPIKRRTIFFSNLLLVLSLSLLYIFILWFAFFIPFLPIFKYLDVNSKISFFTILLASIFITIFLTSLSTLVSMSVDVKLFSFLVGSMPLIALTPFFIAQIAYGFYYNSVTENGLKNNFLLSQDSKTNKKNIGKERTQFDSTIELNHSTYRYDEEGNVKKEHQKTKYENLTDPSNYAFAKIYKVLYPFNLYEYFDNIVKLHSNNIYNNNEISYSNIVHVSKIDLSNAAKNSISFDSAFPKNKDKKIKIALSTSKQELLNSLASVTYKKNDSQEYTVNKQSDEENKIIVNKYLDFLSNFYSNVFEKNIVKAIELDKHTEVAKNKKELYFEKMYLNKEFQKELINFIVNEKIFRFNSEKESLKIITDLEKSKDDFLTYLKEVKDYLKKNQKRFIIDFYKRLETFFETTAMYSFFRYANEKNITFENVFLITEKQEKNGVFELGPEVKLYYFNSPKISIPFSLEEIGKDSHYKVTVWVSIPWYISMLVLLTFSIGFIFLGNWKHNKKIFHI